jgi:hydrogenase maturation protein HypF
LTGDYRGFRRAAHIRYVPMPGGEQAIREPWRMAAAYLADLGQGDALLEARVPRSALAAVRQLIDRRTNAPSTSSVGRLFDGVAALTGIRDRVSYEGQAAMELEWLAIPVVPDGAYSFDIPKAGDGELGDSALVVDTRPLFSDVVADLSRGQEAATIARRFHSTLVELVAQVCRRLRQKSGLDVVVLSGGVFQNALFATEVDAQLVCDGFRVYRHRRVPPGDGGLSCGQLAIAAGAGEASDDLIGKPSARVRTFS